MSEHASGKDPVGPIAPQLGPNLVTIPSTPIGGAPGRRTGIIPEFSVPVPEGPDRLVFRATRRDYRARYLAGPAALFLLFAIDYWVQGRTALALIMVVLGALLMIAAISDAIFGASAVAFDRGTGLVAFGRPSRQKTRALTGVGAVQLIQEGSWLFYKYYQLNLVWVHPEGGRLCLVSSTDASLDWVRHTGKQLAEFLGVPLLDQTLVAS